MYIRLYILYLRIYTRIYCICIYVCTYVYTVCIYFIYVCIYVRIYCINVCIYFMYCIYLYEATDAREARIEALVTLYYFPRQRTSKKILLAGGVLIKILKYLEKSVRYFVKISVRRSFYSLLYDKSHPYQMFFCFICNTG